jgi:hypothetical protein
MTRLCRNLLNNGGETAMLARQKSPLILYATSLKMTMAARWRSPRILDSAKTAMARLHSDLLNDCGKTAILAHQQSPSIWWCDIFDMAMAARRKSSRILDGGNTAMSAHRLLDNDGVQRVSELFDSTLFVGR